MNIQKEVEKILLKSIKDNAKQPPATRVVDTSLLLGLESMSSCIVLLKKDGQVIGKLSLKSMLGVYSIFYGSINEKISKALVNLSNVNNIELSKTFVEVKIEYPGDDLEIISLTLFNGFTTEIKAIGIDEILV